MTASARSRIVTLRDVEPERVAWLWPGRVPLGKLTLLVGDPEAGKSTIALDLAARMTRGTAMPDGAPCEAGHVLYCTLEDGLADTVRPRLDAAGADCARVHSLTGIIDTDDDGQPRGERLPELPADLGHLEGAITGYGIRLVVLDPLKAYMMAGNEWRDGDVRRILGPLAALAERRNVAVLAIVHLTKAAGTPAQYRVSGSIAFTGAARSVLLAAPDPQAPDNGRRVLAPLKSSLSRRAASLAYSIVAADGTDDGPSRIAWGGTCEVTARQALAAQGQDEDQRSQRDEAVDWLLAELADGPRPAREMLREAGHAGISQRTLERARPAAGVHSVRIGGLGGRGEWVWTLNGNGTKDAKKPYERHTLGVAVLGESGGLSEPETPEEAERRGLQEGA